MTSVSSKQPLVVAILCLFLGATAALAAVGGTATLSGAAPAETRIKMNADPKCIALHDGAVTTGYYLVDEDGGLADVFVYVKNPPAGDHAVPNITMFVVDCHKKWFFAVSVHFL